MNIAQGVPYRSSTAVFKYAQDVINPETKEVLIKKDSVH